MPLRPCIPFTPLAPRFQSQLPRQFQFHTSATLHNTAQPTHYEILQIPPNASQAEVKKAFYSLSKTHQYVLLLQVITPKSVYTNSSPSKVQISTPPTPTPQPASTPSQQPTKRSPRPPSAQPTIPPSHNPKPTIRPVQAVPIPPPRLQAAVQRLG